jgi:uncharacterized spore protein YtfJ
MDSNHRPTDYESAALTAVLRALMKKLTTDREASYFPPDAARVASDAAVTSATEAGLRAGTSSSVGQPFSQTIHTLSLRISIRIRARQKGHSGCSIVSSPACWGASSIGLGKLIRRLTPLCPNHKPDHQQPVWHSVCTGINQMHELLKSIIEPLQESAAVKSVFGEPVVAQGRTIIPVARIAYGFGGGGGKGVRNGAPGEGEGGGGGVVAIPLGVVEMTDRETRFIPLHQNRKLVAAGFAGVCLGLLWARRAKLRKSAAC